MRRGGAAIASRREWMRGETGWIRVNHCQIAAMCGAVRAQCAKAVACMVARCGPPTRKQPPGLSGEPAKQDRDRCSHRSCGRNGAPVRWPRRRAMHAMRPGAARRRGSRPQQC